MLGVTEAGFFPAATYLVSAWYCKFEVQTRIGIFYCSASLAGAFSGILAFGISKMDGVANLAGWRWIFILEGIVTVLTGLLVFVLLPDSPETSRWLSAREKEFHRYRLEQDSGTKEGRVNTTGEIRGQVLDHGFDRLEDLVYRFDILGVHHPKRELLAICAVSRYIS